MLTIRCSACKKKLWKYEKFGHGQVLRCHKKRITTIFSMQYQKGKVVCECSKVIGIDKGSFIKMVEKSFIHTGRKSNKG